LAQQLSDVQQQLELSEQVRCPHYLGFRVQGSGF
jgi:hypothetical protein